MLIAPAAAWLLHLAEIFDSEEEWHVAEAHINEAGGLPWELEFRPPVGGPHFDEVDGWEEWAEALGAHPLPVDRAHFRHQMSFRAGAPFTSPVEIALQLLVYDDSIDRDGMLLRNWLHRVTRRHWLGDREGLSD